MTQNSAFGFKKPQDSPGFLLWQTTRLWQHAIKKSLKARNISHTEFVILALLLWFEEQKTPVHQRLLISWSKLDKMSVSKAIKNLVTRGCVMLSEHEDPRAKTVNLTYTGRKFTPLLIPLVENTDKAFLKALDKDEQKTFIALLIKIIEAQD